MVYDKVVEYIVAQLPVKAEDITPETKLLKDLKADSANLMMLIMDLETEFNITVEDEAMMKIETVGDIVDYVEAHI